MPLLFFRAGELLSEKTFKELTSDYILRKDVVTGAFVPRGQGLMIKSFRHENVRGVDSCNFPKSKQLSALTPLPTVKFVWRSFIVIWVSRYKFRVAHSFNFLIAASFRKHSNSLGIQAMVVRMFV